MNLPSRPLLLALKIGIPLMIAILLSLVITIVNHGFTSAFFVNWMKGLVVALIIVPLGIRLIPYVGAGVRRIVGNRSPVVLRSIVAICVAVMMECLVSLSVTLAQYGVMAGWLTLWGNAFVKALPIGLLIGFTMTFIVHPWMQRLGRLQ